MNMIKTDCPTCGNDIEFPRDLDSLICANCGSSFHVREFEGAIGLTTNRENPAVGPNSRSAAVDLTLEELEEGIADASEQIEALKSKEHAAPLQLGCAVFGTFIASLVVIAVFMSLGRNYFGGWLFYLSLAAVVLAGLIRLRSRLPTPAQIENLRRERVELTAALSRLEAERDRLVAAQDAEGNADSPGSVP